MIRGLVHFRTQDLYQAWKDWDHLHIPHYLLPWKCWKLNQFLWESLVLRVFPKAQILLLSRLLRREAVQFGVQEFLYPTWLPPTLQASTFCPYLRRWVGSKLKVKMWVGSVFRAKSAVFQDTQQVLHRSNLREDLVTLSCQWTGRAIRCRILVQCPSLGA